MATPSLVQAGTPIVGNAAYLEVTLTGVAAGNLLIASAQLTSASTRTFTASDDKSNTWASALTYQDSTRDGQISYAKNVTSGDTVVRMTISSTGVNYVVEAIEVANCSTTSPLDVTDQLNESVATDNHVCSSAGVNTSADVIVYSHGTLNSASGVSSVAKGASYTALYESVTDLGTVIQYRISAGALTSEQAPWTSVGTDRTGGSGMAVFKADAAAAAHPLPQRVLVGPTVGPFRGPF